MLWVLLREEKSEERMMGREAKGKRSGKRREGISPGRERIFSR